MKMITAVDRKDGAHPALVIGKSSHDYAVAAAIGTVPVCEAASAIREAMDAVAPEDLPALGHVTVRLLGEDVSVDRKLAGCLSLLRTGDARYGDMLCLVSLSASSKFRKATLDACRPEAHGALRLLAPSELPCPAADPAEFADACVEALSRGAVCVPHRMTGGHQPGDGSTRSAGRAPSQRTHLCDYLLEVCLHGVRRRIRLDLAMALAKRGTKLPMDAYGKEIAGIAAPVGSKKWVVAYALGDERLVRTVDSGNIDHVVPRSEGGRTRLCNLQVMCSAENARKASVIVPDVSGEPVVSLRVVMTLAEGVARAHAEGRLDEDVLESAMAICRREVAACAGMLMGLDLPPRESGCGRAKASPTPVRDRIAGIAGAAAMSAVARRNSPVPRRASSRLVQILRRIDRTSMPAARV